MVEKGPRKSWSNAKGAGSLFSVDLVDAGGTQIRGTFFKDAVDRFYDFLEVGKVYLVSNGRLKIANKAFANLANDYEISFDDHAIIRCVDTLLWE